MFCGGRLSLFLEQPSFLIMMMKFGNIKRLYVCKISHGNFRFATPLRLFLILALLITVNQMLLGGNSFLARAVFLSVSERKKVW